MRNGILLQTAKLQNNHHVSGQTKNIIAAKIV